MRRALGAVLLAMLLAPPALADGVVVRVVRPINLTALPLIVMQHEHLIERTAEAMGLGQVTVTWKESGEADPLAALAAGNADLAMAGLMPFLVAADGVAGASGAIGAVGAVAQRPYVLVTRNKSIHTIADFAAVDRIAVPALPVSGPAVMLEMAAAQEWGQRHYDRLDRLAVARPDAAAATALVAGTGDIDAHFSRTPYVDAELADPAIHRVMDSFDIAGPHTIAVLVSTMRFRTAHIELSKAILSALQAADDLIAKTPGAAAEIFADAAKEEDIPLEDLSDMIGDPDLAYRAAPAGVMRIAQFMHGIGRLKRQPGSWRDRFLPESRDLPGN
jgi:NitT/TauT family transport system substrate-binding protein